MTKEEFDSLPRYEQKSIKIYNEMRSDDDLKPPKVISYLCARGTKDPEITGKVKALPEVNYNINVKLSWLIKQLKEKMYTQKGELRKKMVDIPVYLQYDLAALMVLANQAYKDGETHVEISWKERRMLQEK